MQRYYCFVDWTDKVIYAATSPIARDRAIKRLKESNHNCNNIGQKSAMTYKMMLHFPMYVIDAKLRCRDIDEKFEKLMDESEVSK